MLPLTVALLWLLFPAYSGVFQRVRLISEGAAEYITYQFLFEHLSPSLGIFILICLMAAIMSSADSFLLASGFTFSNDFARIYINKKASDKELIFWNRFFVLIAGSFGFAFAILIENIINLWLFGILVSNSLLFIPYLSAWFFKKATTLGVLVAMAASAVLSLLFFGNLKTLNPSNLWIVLAVNISFLTVISMADQRLSRRGRLF